MIWSDFHDSHHHHHHHHQIPPLTIDLNDELVEVEEHQFFTSTPTPKYSQPSSSSSSSPTFFFSAQDHGDHCHSNQLAYHYEHHQAKILAPEGGSYCVEVKNMGGTNQNQNLPNQLGTSVKWMSSKMRIMRKMMSPTSDNINSKQLYSYREDHKQASTSPETDHNSSNITIRVCSDCNTTKTPLWRSGPRGPKSLCNACGIRQRKARRAAMAAAAGNGGTAGEEMTVVIPSKSKLQCKNKRSSSNGGGTCSVAQPKKKSRLGDSQVLSEETKGDSDNDKKINDDKKLCFEDLRIILSNNSAFQRAVFPQDEKEGAILLMALSYGLVQS